MQSNMVAPGAAGRQEQQAPQPHTIGDYDIMTEKKRRRALTAFSDKAFMSSKDARALRILAEYLEPRSRFEHFRVDDTIVFMGSARTKSRTQAEELMRAAEAGNGDREHARMEL